MAKQETKLAGAQGGGLHQRRVPKRRLRPTYPAKPIDLSIKESGMQPRRSIGSLKVSNIKASNVRAEMRAKGPGGHHAAFRKSLRRQPERFAIGNRRRSATVRRQAKLLSDVNIGGPLPKDVADKDTRRGKVTPPATAGGTGAELSKSRRWQPRSACGRDLRGQHCVGDPAGQGRR